MNATELSQALKYGDGVKVARALGVSPNTVYRWVRGEITPNKFAREKLRELYPALRLSTDRAEDRKEKESESRKISD